MFASNNPTFSSLGSTPSGSATTPSKSRMVRSYWRRVSRRSGVEPRLGFEQVSVPVTSSITGDSEQCHRSDHDACAMGTLTHLSRGDDGESAHLGS